MEGTSKDSVSFYGPQDFSIGALINIFKHKFRIVGADLYVLKYAEQHAEQFPLETLQSLRQHLGYTNERPDAKEKINVNVKRR